MKEFKEYIDKHLPEYCDYAIIIDDSNRASLLPVSNTEELVMLKLQGKVHCIKTYDKLYNICFEGFTRAKMIDETGIRAEPLVNFLGSIELGIAVGDLIVDLTRER